MGRRVVLLVLVTAASLWPASAFAATGQLQNGTMIYTAAAGESNNVVFVANPTDFGSPTFEVRDAADVSITPTPPCFNGGQPNIMECPQDGGGTGQVVLFQASLGDGNDTISLQANLPSSIGAGGGADVMSGGPAADFLRGGQQDDTITGGAGADQLVGDDPGVSGGGNDSLDGGADDDTVDGQDGNDTVTGGDGNDQLSGSGGDDRLIADAGQDDLSGGDGVDLADYSARTAPQQLSLDGVRNDGQDTHADNILPDVENITSGSGDDQITGSDVANALDGGAGNDQIAGAGGDDTLTGADGNDSESGGDGADTESGGGGTDSLAGDAGDDSLSGGAGNDVLGGGAGADSLSGDAENDVLGGGAGADSLSGDAGDDDLDGGAGPDVVNGGDGVDTGDYRSRTAAVAVTLDGRPGDGELGEGDNVEGDVENLAGGSGADTFIGSAAGNTLDGGAGEDYSDGGPGSDTLIGGAAGDVLRSRGSSEPDTISCGPGPDFVVAKPSDTIAPDCDRADRGTRQKPKLRDSAVVTPAGGTLQMSPTGIVRRVPLLDKVVLPLRSIVDTVAGAVTVTSAATARKSQTISLEDGAFDITQTTGKLPLTQFALEGGDFSACPAPARTKARRASAAQNKTIRMLWAKGKGRFRTRGRYAAAAVRGTRWQTVDRCDGTLIRVTQGAVTVRDLVKKRSIVVRAGRSYLAKAR